jgi:hypothetical protein
MRCVRSLTLLALSAGVVACASPGRQAAWEKAETPPAAGATATSSSAAAGLSAEASAAWAKRDDKAEVEKAIAAWETLAAQDPSNAQAMISLARGYYFLVDAHLSSSGADADTMKAMYQKGVDWGEKALLVLEPGFGPAMKAGAKFEDEIGKISKDAMPAAYWYCTNLGRFATLSGLQARLFYKDRVAAAMSRIRELDSQFFYSAADRYFGAFYSALPSIAGKDVEKSKKHFAIANEKSPDYLGNKVVQAQFLAVELDDAEMYKSLLEAVLAAPDGEDPNSAPENRGAKRTAKKMLAEMDELF